jgi:hypothetical protein
MTTEGSVAVEQGTIQDAACAHTPCELSASVRQCLESAGSEARHSAERVRVTAERALGKVRRNIEDRPLVALAATGVGCLAVGLMAGWFIGFRRSR